MDNDRLALIGLLSTATVAVYLNFLGWPGRPNPGVWVGLGLLVILGLVAAGIGLVRGTVVALTVGLIAAAANLIAPGRTYEGIAIWTAAMVGFFLIPVMLGFALGRLANLHGTIRIKRSLTLVATIIIALLGLAAWNLPNAALNMLANSVAARMGDHVETIRAGGSRLSHGEDDPFALLVLRGPESRWCASLKEALRHERFDITPTFKRTGEFIVPATDCAIQADRTEQPPITAMLLHTSTSPTLVFTYHY